ATNALTQPASVFSFDAALILAHVVGLIDLNVDPFTFDAVQYDGGVVTVWAADTWPFGVLPDNSDGGDDVIGSIDAAGVLTYVVTGGWAFLAKATAPMADVSFGEISGKEESIVVPLRLENTSGVYSAVFEFDVDENLTEIMGVTKNLPEGWFIAHNVVDGKLKVAMAGVKPLEDGNIAALEIKVLEKEANVTLKGSVSLNDKYDVELLPVALRQIPTEYALDQNYPNPFNPTTKIKYQVPENAKITLAIYNMLGERVRTLVNEIREAGYYTVEWDGRNDYGTQISSGVYIYRMFSDKFVATKKMMFIK
ncbi:T9SS type A sorting domain-containing protein, partial [Bacteroidota bacterium]